MDSNYYNTELLRLKREERALRFAVNTIMRQTCDVENADDLVQLCTMLKSTQSLVDFYAKELRETLNKEQAETEESGDKA